MTHRNQGTKDKKARTEFLAAIIWFVLMSARLCRQQCAAITKFQTSTLFCQISQMDGWMALTLSSASSADPDEQCSWFSPRWCRPHSLSAVFPPQKHSCQLICPVGTAGHHQGHQSRPTSLLGARQSASLTSTYWCIDTNRHAKIFFSLYPPHKVFKCRQIPDTEFRLI